MNSLKEVMEKKSVNMKFFILILITINSISAHQDFFVTKTFGNITTKIKTGFDYEEIKKVEIIGELAHILSKKLKYTKPIFLDFNHEYTGNNKASYFLSFEENSKKKIVIKVFGKKFEINNTLKLIEYSIKNDEKIEKNQKKIEYSGNFYSSKINSIDVNEIKKILKKENSDILNEVINNKIDRPGDPYAEGVTYYWQNNEYYVLKRGYNTNKEIILALYDIYHLERIGSGVFVFDKENSFYFIDDSSLKPIVSKKQTIKNNNHTPPEIKYIGGEKYAIYFYSMIDESKTLLYLKNKDILIQDLDKLIKKTSKTDCKDKAVTHP
jgi:hypothetical protein